MLLLVIFLLFFLIADLEVSQLIRCLITSDHSQPVPEVVLLQVLLGQVLQVSVSE